MIQPIAKGVRDDNLRVAEIEGVVKRKFEVGLVFGGRKTADLDPGSRDICQFGGINRVQVPN